MVDSEPGCLVVLLDMRAQGVTTTTGWFGQIHGRGGYRITFQPRQKARRRSNDRGCPGTGKQSATGQLRGRIWHGKSPVAALMNWMSYLWTPAESNDKCAGAQVPQPSPDHAKKGQPTETGKKATAGHRSLTKIKQESRRQVAASAGHLCHQCHPRCQKNRGR